MMTFKALATVMVTSLLLTGCKSVKSLFPPDNPIVAIRSSWDSSNTANAFKNGDYKKKYEAHICAKEGGSNEAERSKYENLAKAERRKQVYLLLNAIDAYYDRYIKGRLIHGKAAFDTSYEVFLLALTGAASFAGGNTPNVLAGVATATQGTKSSVDKNFFQNSSGIILVIKMDQLRAEAFEVIVKGLNESTEKYPLDQAMRNVIQYYSAGTLKSASIAIVQEAGAKKQIAESNVKTAESNVKTAESGG